MFCVGPTQSSTEVNDDPCQTDMELIEFVLTCSTEDEFHMW